MNFKSSFVALNTALFLVACASNQDLKKTEVHPVKGGHAPASTTEVHHWTYEGEHGPNAWGKMNPDWSVCSTGREQSPVDLKWKKPDKGRSISFFYNSTPAEILDNGHTIQVNVQPGSKVDIGGQAFDLVQFHFHAESEHTLSGKHFPLELHLVHKDSHGKLAVVGVLFKLGEHNDTIEKLWKEIPTDKNKATTLTAKTFDPSRFLPPQTTHYNYKGSLTTPPCTEGVNWNVLNTPVEISAAQLKAFQKLYAHNNRPLQQANGRKPANF